MVICIILFGYISPKYPSGIRNLVRRRYYKACLPSPFDPLDIKTHRLAECELHYNLVVGVRK